MDRADGRKDENLKAGLKPIEKYIKSHEKGKNLCFIRYFVTWVST